MVKKYDLRYYNTDFKNQNMIKLPDKLGDTPYYFFIKYIELEGVEYSCTDINRIDAERVKDFLSTLPYVTLWEDIRYHNTEKSPARYLYGKVCIRELSPAQVFLNIHTYNDDKKDLSSISLYFPENLSRNAHIIKLVEEFRRIQSESNKYEYKVSTIVSDQSLYFADFDLVIPDTNLELNYGKGFTSIHDVIVKKLTSEQSGIYIFEGPPGTGKTTYIKNLIKHVKRDFIFIQNSIIEQLDSPQLIKLLIQKPNAVLIFEDAEKAVLKRSTDNQSFVSTILSLSDGFLGSVLNVSIIITYNAEVKDVDQAIFRKGRLKYTHKFDKLSIEDAQRKIDHDKIEGVKVTHPMSLAEIYGAHDDTGYEANTKQIGFAK